VVDKPLGTVKAMLFRAKKILKQDLIDAKLNLE
jgi:DNA-directed RNA polymerase specialized sigma24 family protein